MISRRKFIAASAICMPGLPWAASRRFAVLPEALERLERDHGGRLGVSVLDTGTGEFSRYRGNERFPMCSTFKFLLASAVLERVDRREEMLERPVAVPPMPLLYNSPLTEPNAGGTMAVADLCHAALTRSDNTAANLLLATIGGPPGITRFARSIGDTITRLDRVETELNEARAGDPRDTTSPDAMVGDLKAVLLGHVLSTASRDRMQMWMQANLTGLDRLRAHLPQRWRAADKTGSNGEHTTNDIAVLWPRPDAPPIIVAAYITQCPGPEAKRSAMLADIGKFVRDAIEPR